MSSAAGQNAGAPSRPERRREAKVESRPPSRPSSRASARPPSTAGNLTPAHESHLGSAGSGSGKRKRQGSSVADDDLLKAPVVLKPHPSSLTVKPRILHPLMLLPREYLPLSSLDLSQPHGDFPASRAYESNIKILDLEGRLGSNILLARSETSRMVYAVERESNGLYVLCKLGSWVDIEGLCQCATVVCRERLWNGKPAQPAGAAALPLTTPLLHKESKRRRLAIEEIQSLVRKRSMSVIEREPQPTQPPTEAAERATPARTMSQNTEAANGPSAVPVPAGSAAPAINDPPAADPAADDGPLSQPSAEDMFHNIRSQYMEALYHSKGSLAYFAKGPLSRARAAFQLDWDCNRDMDDLVDFLKGLVMTTVLIDKKYRETIPEIAAKMRSLAQDSEHGTSKPKKRRLKKPKLGKDGLYPGEVDHIRRWWLSNLPISSGDDENALTATESKYHISCLRRRETQLQMILILEILALEPLARAKRADCQLPGIESRADPPEAGQETPVKKRNKHNLPVLLDVHADRLCIWQSTTPDEVKAVAESQVPSEGHEAEKPDAANSDPLRDFCVDIIMPFFSARLPSPCESLIRKLGGPLAQSPPKQKVAKLASAVKPKPGAPIRRAVASKRDKARTLERALSVERSRRSVSQGPSATIALLRSASHTVIPGLKREASESTLMGLIPKADTGSAKERPTNIFQRSMSLGGAMDLKAQKKAQVEAELQDAISALKKPNRALAVRDFVEAAEKRASAGQLKRMKKPNRASSVQVKATPANNRYKDALAREPSAKSQPLPSFDLPPSSASMVPASTRPQKFANRLSCHSQPAAATTTPVKIHATPARPIPAPLDSSAHVVLTSSPTIARKVSPAPPPPPPVFSSSHRLPVPARGPHHSGLLGADADVDIPPSPLSDLGLDQGLGLDVLFETPVAPRSRLSSRPSLHDHQHSKRQHDPIGVPGDWGNLGSGSPNVRVVDDTPVKSRLPKSRPMSMSRLPLGVVAHAGNRISGGNGDRGGDRSGDGNGESSGGVWKSGGAENEAGLGTQGRRRHQPGYGQGLGQVEEWDGPMKTGDGKEDGVGDGGVSIYQRLGWDTTDLDDIDDLF